MFNDEPTPADDGYVIRVKPSVKLDISSGRSMTTCQPVQKDVAKVQPQNFVTKVWVNFKEIYRW